MPRLSALATAVPPHVITQAEAREGARRLFDGRARQFERMVSVFENAGIDTRHSCVPVEWYFEPHDWQDRSALFSENAVALLEQAAWACLGEADVAPQAVDAVILVCSTGIATPSLDAVLMERMPFRRDVMRLPIFGLGCAGGVLGIGRAAALSRGLGRARVLLLVVELCGLTFRRDDLGKSNIIATALFGDGAAAALIEPDHVGPGAIVAFGEHAWPGTLDVMGWSVETDGLGVIFSRDIPALVRAEMRPAAERFLRSKGLALSEIDRLICHPGGVKVVEALTEAFALAPDALDVERAVLRQYGNMSAATVMFVLAERRRRGVKGRALLTALGPGFTAGFAVLDL